MFVCETAGTYYIAAGSTSRVSGADPGTGAYRVSVSAYADDYAADASTTGTLAVGGSATGTVEGHGDAGDWFAVTLEAGRGYRFDVEGADTSQGTLADPKVLGVFDSSGQKVSGSDDDDDGDGRNARAYVLAETGGTYYVAAGGGGYLQGSNTGTYRVSAAAVPVVSVEDAEGDEESESPTVRFRVSLDRAATETVRVDYATADGTAVAWKDYYPLVSGTVTFEEGDTEQWVEVTIINDDEEDSGETFTLTLSGATGAVLGDAEAEGTIHNTEPVTVSEPAGEDFSADTTTSGSIVVGETASGVLTGSDLSVRVIRETVLYGSDRDWFRIVLEAGETYRVEVATANSGSVGNVFARPRGAATTPT